MEPKLKKIEELIKAGKMTLARRQLSSYRYTKVPRNYAFQLAALARRANLPTLSIRLLNPIVRPPTKARITASDLEKSEYAAALIRIGAITEALGILQTVDEKKTPESLLYQAYGFIAKWNYNAALPLLSRYLSHESLGKYPLLIGKVNLAACLVHEKHPASPILEELLEETRKEKAILLLGNSLELSAQYAISKKNWKKGEEYKRG